MGSNLRLTEGRLNGALLVATPRQTSGEETKIRASLHRKARYKDFSYTINKTVWGCIKIADALLARQDKDNRLRLMRRSGANNKKEKQK